MIGDRVRERSFMKRVQPAEARREASEGGLFDQENHAIADAKTGRVSGSLVLAKSLE